MRVRLQPLVMLILTTDRERKSRRRDVLAVLGLAVFLLCAPIALAGAAFAYLAWGPVPYLESQFAGPAEYMYFMYDPHRKVVLEDVSVTGGWPGAHGERHAWDVRCGPRVYIVQW